MAPVLKTGGPERVPGVRIPRSPLYDWKRGRVAEGTRFENGRTSKGVPQVRTLPLPLL